MRLLQLAAAQRRGSDVTSDVVISTSSVRRLLVQVQTIERVLVWSGRGRTTAAAAGCRRPLSVCSRACSYRSASSGRRVAAPRRVVGDC